MNKEKTFEAISKLKDIEIELHRLKNALEMANKALEAKRQWVGLTDEEIAELMVEIWNSDSISPKERSHRLSRAVESKLREKNT